MEYHHGHPRSLAMIPPALVVILMQKWFVKGLVDTEK
ncbi:sn-glycerol-3-phosphate ABC transporter permease [Bordetella pertussis]|nr:sn-glycerol-3-phosphate ABC transporter permease [Bordetella pertussis]